MPTAPRIEQAVAALGRPPGDDELAALARLRGEVGSLAVGLARHAGATPTPPPTPADRWPDERGLPEVGGHELDADAIGAALGHHGGLVVRRLLDEPTTARLRAELDRADGVPPAVPGVATTPRGLHELLTAFHAAGVVTALAEHLGAAPVIAGNRAKLRRDQRRQGMRKGLPWHQDAAFFLGATGGVGVWVALTPVGRDRPGLDLVAARQPGVLGIDAEALAAAERPTALAYADELGADLLALAEGGDRVVSPVLEPGDAVLLDDLTVHRTGTTSWSAPAREVAISWFFDPARFPRVPFSALAT